MAVITVPFSSQGAVNRIGDEFKKSPDDFRTVHKVQKYREFRLRCLTTSIKILNDAKLPKFAFVSARLKRLDSIYRKLTRLDSNFKLGQLDDIIGLRVICRSFTEAQELSKRIGKLPQKFSTRDYTAPGEKQTGYRCTHHTMRFSQKLGASSPIDVRFEIQIRSFYQHQWAVLSEAHGENAKLGMWDDRDNTEQKLLETANRIAEWEQKNPEAVQDPLAPLIVNNPLFTVVWKQNVGSIIVEPYSNDESAINYLNYLELSFPEKRNNALLLVGISNKNAEYLLARTHPSFVTGKAPLPETWMPEL